MTTQKNISIAFSSIAIILAMIFYKVGDYTTQKTQLSLHNKYNYSALKNTSSHYINSDTNPRKTGFFNPTKTLDTSNISTYIEEHLRTDSSDHSVLKLSETIYSNGYKKETIDILSKQIKSNLGQGKEISIESLQLLRSAMQQSGYLIDYKTLLSSIPDDYPTKPNLLSEMSVYLSQQGDLFDAESVLLDGLHTFPNNPSILDSYASLLKLEGRFNEAESAYQHMLEIEDTAETRIELGKLYLESQNFNAAQETFNKITNTAPGYKEEISRILKNN